MIEYGISLDPRTLFDIDILGKERINPINVGFRRWAPLPFVPPPLPGFTPVSPRPHTPARVHTHTHARARTRALHLTSWASEDHARAIVCTEHVARDY